MQGIILKLAYRTKPMPELSDNVEDKIIAQYTGSSWQKWYTNYQGEYFQENIIYNFSILLHKACLHWQDLSQLQLVSAFWSS